MRIVWGLLLLLILSLGCIGEEPQVQTSLPPETTPSSIETTVAPQTTAPPTTTPTPVVTTKPPPTNPPEALGPVSDYLLKQGIYGLDVSPLEEDGSLDENDKDLINVISSIEIKTSWRDTPFPSMIEDGEIDDEELNYAGIRVKVSNEIGSNYATIVDGLWDNKHSLITQLSEIYHKDTEIVTQAIKLSYPVSEIKTDYLADTLQWGLLDIAFNPVFYGDNIDNSDRENLMVFNDLHIKSSTFRDLTWEQQIEIFSLNPELYQELDEKSETFPQRSFENQKDVLNIWWIKDGIDDREIKDLDLIPIDVEIDNIVANTYRQGGAFLPLEHIYHEGPRCLSHSFSMIFKYWGKNVTPEEIIDFMGLPPFSRDSFSELESFTRSQGLDFYYLSNGDINDIRTAIDNGWPLNVLQAYTTIQPTGHNRDIVGYDDYTQQVIIYDSDIEIGPNYRLSYEEFMFLWNEYTESSPRKFYLIVPEGTKIPYSLLKKKKIDNFT